jgi:hypothetical protein
MMLNLFAAAGIAAQLVTPVVDRLPDFDVGPSCRAGANSGVSLRQDAQACMQNEQRAKDQLKQSWRGYSSADTSRCLRLTHTGGPPSYVEVLTCIEMMDAARKIPDANAGVRTGDSNTGVATGATRSRR